MHEHVEPSGNHGPPPAHTHAAHDHGGHGAGGHGRPGDLPDVEHLGHGDQPDTHGMLVVGEAAVFFSHLPMFNHPHHDFQVLLEVTLSNGHGDPHATYVEDRHRTGERLYTFEPEPFVLPDLIRTTAEGPRRRSFRGAIVRGHFERGGAEIARATATVANVVHFRQFDPDAPPLQSLEYILFGKHQELFAAHLIIRPPDFDQVVAVTVRGHAFDHAEVHHGLRLVIPDRPNTLERRLQPGETAMGQVLSPGAGSRRAVEVELAVGTEFYFEEGELRAQADFKQTAAERQAGF